jgi:hypothetical protein
MIGARNLSGFRGHPSLRNPVFGYENTKGQVFTPLGALDIARQAEKPGFSIFD